MIGAMQPTKILKVDEPRQTVFYLFEPPDDNLGDAFEDRVHLFMMRGGGGASWQAIESFIPDTEIRYAGEPVSKGSWIAAVKFQDPGLFETALKAAEDLEDGDQEAEDSEEGEEETGRGPPAAAWLRDEGRDVAKAIVAKGDVMPLDKRKIVHEQISEQDPEAIRQQIWEFLCELVEELQAEMPDLSDQEAFEKVCKTDQGQVLYRAYRALENPRKARRESGIGPAARELEEKKERLVHKSGGRLSEGDAYRKIFSSDPDLYARYVEEVKLSTR